MPKLAGVSVSAALTGELASRLRDDGSVHISEKLEEALAHNKPIVALSIRDREQILAVLGDPPDGLEELRGVLLREREWRQREGL